MEVVIGEHRTQLRVWDGLIQSIDWDKAGGYSKASQGSCSPFLFSDWRILIYPFRQKVIAAPARACLSKLFRYPRRLSVSFDCLQCTLRRRGSQVARAG